MIIEHKTIELHGKMLFEKAIIKPPFKKPHPMPDEACFLYVLEGKNETISNTTISTITEKEALLMKCGTYFTRMFPSQISGLYEAVAVHFHPYVIRKVYKDHLPGFMSQANATPTIGISKVKVDELIEQFISNVLYYFKNPEMATQEILEIKLKELMVLLGNSKRSYEIKQILQSLFTPSAHTFKEIIASHLFSNLSMVELSELTNLSISSFKREFKKIYNDSPANYIKTKKLEKAKELLIVGEQSVSEIAYDCGFNDLTGFSRSFKEKFGISPSSLRLNQNAKPMS